MIYATFTNVRKVERRVERVYKGGYGQDAVFEDKDLGWYAVFEGSYEALHLGMEKPFFASGDRIKITFEKVS